MGRSWIEKCVDKIRYGKKVPAYQHFCLQQTPKTAESQLRAELAQPIIHLLQQKTSAQIDIHLCHLNKISNSNKKTIAIFKQARLIHFWIRCGPALHIKNEKPIKERQEKLLNQSS
jgi:hypothetical protein